MNKAVYSLSILALLSTGCGASAQQAFKTPDEAASALVNAVKADDIKALTTVLGPDDEDIVSSGDPVADATTRQKFLAAYDTRHEIALDGDNKATIVIGQESYPLPIPLVGKDGQWRFDTAAGREEIHSDGSAATSLTPFKPVLPMSMHRMNTPRRIAPAPGSILMRNALSVGPGKRTVSTGQPGRVKS